MPKTKNKKSKAEDVEIEDDDDLELEDLDEDVEEEDAPAKSKAQDVEFGASDLAKYLSEKTGKNISARELRALIRKMAREDDPRVNREVVPGNRTRYNWPGGLKNPEVKVIIAAVTGGELEADKQAKLADLKAKKAAKVAAGETTSKKSKKSKKGKKAAPVEEPEDDDVEEIEIDDDDE